MDKLRLRGGSPVREAPLGPWPRPAPEIADYVTEILRTGALACGQIGIGPGGIHKRELEERFAQLVGTRHAVAVNSGTTALDLAIEALHLAPGGTILAADYGHPSTIRGASLRHRLELLDVDPRTLCLDPWETETALQRDDVRCVITTHFAGQVAGTDRLRELCASAGVPLVEDASHAHGARAYGRSAGSFGALGAFSLHATKNLTSAEGGILTFDDSELFERVWRSHDLGRDLGASPYEFKQLAGNYRMSEIHALLAVSGLASLQDDNARRARGVEHIRQSWCSPGPLELLPLLPSTEVHAYHILAARYVPGRCGGMSRKRFVLAMCAEGLPCSEGWPRRLSEVPGVREHCRSHATPHALAATRETIWFDQRILLDDEGPAQLVAATAKIERLAATLVGS